MQSTEYSTSEGFSRVELARSSCPAQPPAQNMLAAHAAGKQLMGGRALGLGTVPNISRSRQSLTPEPTSPTSPPPSIPSLAPISFLPLPYISLAVLYGKPRPIYRYTNSPQPINNLTNKLLLRARWPRQNPQQR